MSDKDNRGKCDVCGGATGGQHRAKVVFRDASDKELFHQEAHRGRCLGVVAQSLAANPAPDEAVLVRFVFQKPSGVAGFVDETGREGLAVLALSVFQGETGDLN